ncbi:prolycopene isomerase [Lentzea atacamensis]|uniref:Prolycopene isomerase n=1 Tax=Lentzea atacamensis TaxID=531938 RepID=A0A316HVZ0_9PSEU|nr:NAD(P)/FAD-dependent oxidoreductase [Lentzea atacamensis]PWK84856.1 prolycopene isomerase [Lentzea atacamensis]
MTGQGYGGEFDVVVVGSGLGGLATAAYLARHGRRVLVAERAAGVGGYAHGFTRDGRYFDPAIHVVPEAGPGGTLRRLLDHLDVAGECDFVDSDLLYRAVIGSTALDVPFGSGAVVEAYVAAFPHEAAGIRSFFGLCERFLAEARQLPVRLSARELGAAVRGSEVYFQHRRATLAEVLNAHISDPRCRAFCAAGWPYMGLPPSQLSFELYARFLQTQLHGLSHCVGGFQRLVDAFVSAIEKRGGTVAADTPVKRVVLRSGRVAGVLLGDGGLVRAPVVVSNADAWHTFHDLVGMDHVPPAYARRLARLRPSMSMFVVYAASTCEIDPAGAAHETFLFTGDDHDLTFRRFQRGQAPASVVVVPTLLDRSLAPAGEHLFTSTALAPYDAGQDWAELKPVLQEQYLDLVEQLYPGFRSGLTHVESATPHTLERFTGNRFGAAYGWENTPDQAGSKRLAHSTPIEGLYLAGHWTQAASALRVIVSGCHAAREILLTTGETDAGPTF